ncbi:MAG: response regulator transcription factor [Pedobacter sp.]|nr:MAG: response regulator transcription factor [Pedobacter sp.]
MEKVNSTKVFIVDDHQLVIDGIQALLKDESDYTIVGTSQKATEVLDRMYDLNVDILITDINMPEMSGIVLTKQIKLRYPGIKILALSMFGDRHVIKEMIEAGINGYILKNTGKVELMEALEKVSKGQCFFSDEVTKVLVRSFKKEEEFSHLTNREIEIIRLIEQELSNKQIANALFISERTVETHRKNIFRKTGTQSVVGLLKYAYEHKLI